MHAGAASSGHYWSYINTQRGEDEPDTSDPSWEKSEDNSWLEFNDKWVSEFNPLKIGEECFGGDGKKANNALDADSAYGKSAYMLFYEKREKNPIKVICPAEEIGAVHD
jgi:ubiquitin carboxyl-terminal hydrolase 34